MKGVNDLSNSKLEWRRVEYPERPTQEWSDHGFVVYHNDLNSLESSTDAAGQTVYSYRRQEYTPNEYGVSLLLTQLQADVDYNSMLLEALAG